MCNTTIDRLLEACHLGRRQAPTQANQDPSVSQPLYLPLNTTRIKKEITYESKDLVPLLNKEMNRFQLAGSLIIEVTVELTGEAFSKSEKNDLFEVDVKKFADFKFDDLTSSMKEVCKNVDKDETNTKITIELLQQTLTKQCEAFSKLISVSLNNEIRAYMASNKAIKAGYRNYQIKCVHEVASDFVVIAAGIGATAASWGATGPVAVVAIARSTVGLVQKFFYMAIEAGTLADIIDGYFKVIAVLMTKIEEDDKNPTPKIAWNSAKEFGLGAIAGVLNVDVPSVSVIGGQMKKLEAKMKGIHTERINIGKKATRYRKQIEAYQKRVDAEQATLTREEMANHSVAILKLDADQEKIFEKAEEMYEALKELIVRQRAFQAQLETYKEAQKGFVRYSKAVFGFATSVGLGIGSAGAGALEHAMAAVNECLRNTLEIIADKALER